MSMMKEFRDFALKGNVVDLAVGVIIGGAFGKIVDSMVKDIIMPIVGAIFGGLDFSNYFIPLVASDKLPQNVPYTYEALNKAGVPLFAYGNFITIFLNFLILAFIIFQMVRVFNKAKNALIKEEAAAPAAPPEDVVLLREIRDELKKKA
ncbi:MAG: large conductance mechanosensitive channel protein MscL [Lautropia sp.]|nr:large conductance mechanosensitive channel protein MscL [Lautropia sp.]